jgi:hypothetical protein
VTKDLSPAVMDATTREAVLMAVARGMIHDLQSSLAQETFKERKSALEDALNGDWVPLGDYFRRGGRLTPEIRAFVVDAMCGKRTQPRRKTSPRQREKRDMKMARRILALRAKGEKRAIDKVAEQFGLEQQQARRAFKKHAATAAELFKKVEFIKAQAPELLDIVHRAYERRARKVRDYVSRAFSTPEYFVGHDYFIES